MQGHGKGPGDDFDRIDTDHNNVIDFDEFKQARERDAGRAIGGAGKCPGDRSMLGSNKSPNLTDPVIRKGKYDKQGSTRDGPPNDFDRIDTNHNDAIDFDEFKRARETESEAAKKATGLTAGAAVIARRGSVGEAANAAAKAAEEAGASHDEVAAIAGETAGAAVLAQGGSKEAATLAAANAARQAGGSPAAQGAAAGAAVGRAGGPALEAGIAASQAARRGGGSDAEAQEAASKSAAAMIEEQGGSPEQVAQVSCDAAKQAGASRDVAAELAGEAAGAAVVHAGGNVHGASQVAAQAAKDTGGSPAAEAKVHIPGHGSCSGQVGSCSHLRDSNVVTLSCT